MARLILPEDFESQYKLAKLVNQKHIADGAGSVLTPYLTEQDFLLSDVVVDGAAAEVQEALRAKLRRDSEKHRNERDLAFSPVFKTVTGGTQFLKTLFKPNYHKLGDWSITVNGVSRIAYPKKFIDRTTLVTDFYAKHTTYPAGTSPLEPFVVEHTINIPALTIAIGNATTSDALMSSTSNSAETARQNRDNLWNPRWEQVKGTGLYLMKLLPGNEKKVGDWGYTIDDSPKAPKLRKSKILLLETKTLKGVVIGSTFHNTGATTLNLYKGSTATPAGITILPGEKYGFTKGWSNITVVNVSALESGSFTTLVHQD